MSFQFTQDQIKAIDNICSSFTSKSVNKSPIINVLTGAAGTGKTTVIGEVIERLRGIDPLIKISLCATTHRAAHVLEQIVGETVYTGHGLFKLRPSVGKSGREDLTKVGICEIPFESIVIIDEASMIGNKFLEAIVDIVQHRNLKMLFVGDPFQLPPPVDRCSIFDGSLTTFPLKQVHRQAGGNPILSKATEYRKFLENEAPEPILETCLNSQGEGIHILPHKQFVTKFVEKYMDYTAGTDVDVPLCTYTNDSAINYNSMIRKAAYFLEENLEPFYKGERLIANSVVMEGDRTILTNNETVHVCDYIEAEQCEIPGYIVTVKGEFNTYSKTDIKKVFSPVSKSAADTILKKYKDIAIKNKTKDNWVNFYKLKNSLADLRPPFAGTTHKAQGGTFPAVFIDRLNINKCRNPTTRARLFYVALTRATTNVYINS